MNSWKLYSWIASDYFFITDSLKDLQSFEAKRRILDGKEWQSSALRNECHK